MALINIEKGDSHVLSHSKKSMEGTQIISKIRRCSYPVIKDAEGIRSLLTAASMTGNPTPSPQTSLIPRPHSPPGVKGPRLLNDKISRRTPRDHRPMYTQEEADAILYYRDSVGLAWKKVVKAWNRLFDAITGQQWGPRTISGLQSHYYRMLGIDKTHGRRPSAPNPDIGLLKATNRRYWWNYGFHPSVLQELEGSTAGELKIASKQHIRRLKKEDQREGRRQRKLTRRQFEKDAVPQYQSAIFLKDAEPRCSNLEIEYAEDADSASSLSDTHSNSDADGYETSTSTPPPSFSHTSAPTSPFGDFGAKPLNFPSERLENKSNILPSCKDLVGMADRGADRRDTKIINWQNRLETLPCSENEKPGAITLRQVNRNPMAVASLLSF
ncbi:hypothetical protein H072_6230 [Dactylellina haptotyla CBS 200.50]|uniref:Uncharacterized protein n=1 Tax=Dactylellina haptotyla (strain CBS 200.50) TaxID=1284197 RepID=S8AA73_DACHA|nr:hypothetical protein H072_6230 [Dactylellina haptotyla CBS 200.50]